MNFRSIFWSYICNSCCIIDNAKQIAGFGEEYFGTSDGRESNKSFLEGYKSVLNSKQAEENLVRERNQNYIVDSPSKYPAY